MVNNLSRKYVTKTQIDIFFLFEMINLYYATSNAITEGLICTESTSEKKQLQVNLHYAFSSNVTTGGLLCTRTLLAK